MRRRALLALVLVGAAVLLPSAAAEQGASSTAMLPRLVSPADGQAYFGLTFPLFDTSDPVWGDDRPFAERIKDSIDIELSGKPPAFIKVWTPWQKPDLPKKPLVRFSEAAGEVAKVRGVIGDSGLLFLDWNLTTSTAVNDGITTRDIARGALDRYIRAYARDIKAYGLPVQIMLFNGEYNGDWWWAVSPRANSSLTITDFVKAWRRVVDIFRAVGATNASWAWVVNGYPANPAEQPQIDRDIGAYYPGDEYVDWVGADVYDVGTPNWIDSPYAFAVAHSKPVWIGEFGIRHEWSSTAPSQWRTWLEASFDYFENHPAVKAISYFNLNNRAGAGHVKWDPSRDVYLYGGHVRYTPNVNDHDHRLLAGGPAIRATFARRIASGRYLSTVSTEAVDSQPQPPAVALLIPTVRGLTATARWHDFAIKPRSRAWQVVATHLAATSYRLKGEAGARMLVRVRPRDVFGSSGSWSASRRIVFAER
jgi:Glycosyl hydrolase family 26